MAGSNWNNGVNYIYFVNIINIMETKLIRVKKDTYHALMSLGKKGESFDTIIRRHLPPGAYKDD